MPPYDFVDAAYIADAAAPFRVTRSAIMSDMPRRAAMLVLFCATLESADDVCCFARVPPFA